MKRGGALVVGGLLLLAGCAGAFGGGTTETASGTATVTETATPGATQSPTATPTPTPAESEQYPGRNETAIEYSHTYLSYLLASGRYSPYVTDPGTFYDRARFELQSRTGTIYFEYQVPDNYTLQEAEMQWAQEVALKLDIYTSENLTKVRENTEVLGQEPPELLWLYRPEAVVITFQSDTGQNISRVRIDSEAAVEYARGNLSQYAYIDRLNQSRSVFSPELTSESKYGYLGELRRAEYRPIFEEQMRLIEQGGFFDERNIDLRAKMQVNESSRIESTSEQLHYYWTSSSTNQTILGSNVVARTYWQALKNSTSQTIVPPERVSFYVNVTNGQDYAGHVPSEAAISIIQDGRVTDSEALRYLSAIQDDNIPDSE